MTANPPPTPSNTGVRVGRRRLLAAIGPAAVGAGAVLAGCGVKLSMVKPTATFIPDDAVPRIDVADAFRAVNAGRAVLIDVRGDESWHSRHASGALSIPVDQIETAPLRAFAPVPAGKEPILYCT
jgi:hypothetical protein